MQSIFSAFSVFFCVYGAQCCHCRSVCDKRFTGQRTRKKNCLTQLESNEWVNNDDMGEKNINEKAKPKDEKMNERPTDRPTDRRKTETTEEEEDGKHETVTRWTCKKGIIWIPFHAFFFSPFHSLLFFLFNSSFSVFRFHVVVTCFCIQWIQPCDRCFRSQLLLWMSFVVLIVHFT